MWLINDKKVEVFEGGYTQVAPYLHTIEMEKASAKSPPSSPKKKPEPKEKVDLDKVESEIERLEAEKEANEKAIFDFDYTRMDELKAEYENLESEKSRIQAELDELWKTLSKGTSYFSPKSVVWT